MSRIYKVTRFIDELGFSISINVKSELSADELMKRMNTPLEGMNNVLSKVISVQEIDPSYDTEN